jgi:hypothetical protein
MNNKLLATESFSNNRKHYFLDFKRAANNSQYIKIVRSDEQADHTYKRSEVIIFEEDFEFLIEAFSALFKSAAHQVSQPELFKPPASPERTTGIKSWDAECRPREKLMAQGRDTMADAELIALLISSGSPRETAVSLAGRILTNVDFSLKRLSELTVTELCAFRGMGHAKSLTIISAMELAKRMIEEQTLLGFQE